MAYGRPVPTSRIHIHPDGWERECRRHGLRTSAMRAEFLGVTRQTITNAQAGKPVSAEFVAAALEAFPWVRFEDLFTTSRARVRVRVTA